MAWNLQAAEQYSTSIFKSAVYLCIYTSGKRLLCNKEQNDPDVCIHRAVLALKQNKKKPQKKQFSLVQNTVKFNSKQDTEVQAPVF